MKLRNILKTITTFTIKTTRAIWPSRRAQASTAKDRWVCDVICSHGRRCAAHAWVTTKELAELRACLFRQTGTTDLHNVAPRAVIAAGEEVCLTHDIAFFADERDYKRHGTPKAAATTQP